MYVCVYVIIRVSCQCLVTAAVTYTLTNVHVVSIVFILLYVIFYVQNKVKTYIFKIIYLLCLCETKVGWQIKLQKYSVVARI